MRPSRRPYRCRRPSLSGPVAFYDGNPTSGGTLLGTVPLNSQDQAIYTTTTLNVAGSPHQIYAVYGGSSYYAGSGESQPASVTITPATITASLTGTVSKAYDGTTAATLSAGNYHLSGVLGNDFAVTLIDATSGTYDTKDAGSGKMVSVTGLTISARSRQLHAGRQFDLGSGGRDHRPAADGDRDHGGGQGL